MSVAQECRSERALLQAVTAKKRLILWAKPELKLPQARLARLTRGMVFRYAPGSFRHPEALKEKKRLLRGGVPMPLTLRVHRSLSWLRRAQAEKKTSTSAGLK